MQLDPRRLMTMRAVAAAGSISAGAKALGWTQPAVTRHLQELERSIGMPVFIRRSSGVELTPAGLALMAHAEAIASHLEAAVTEITELKELRRGTVRLACFPSGLAVIAPAALAQLPPGIDVHLVEAEPDPAVELLHDGQVDIAMTFNYAEESPDDEPWLQERVIGVDPIVLVVPHGQPATSLLDVAEQPWIAGCQRCRTHLLTIAHAAGFDPKITHATDDYVVVQSLIGRGLGVALLPRLAAAAFKDPGVDVVALPGLGARRITARFRPGAEHVPGNAALLRALQTVGVSRPTVNSANRLLT